MIPAQRAGTHDDDNAALHAEVARIFTEQAEAARQQSRFLLTVQTAGTNREGAFRAAVADRLQQHADAEQKLTRDPAEAAR